MTLFNDLLKQYLDKNFDEYINQFARYLELLTKWNKTYNLTSITDPKEMVIRHILDSLSIQPFLKGKRIIDVGTGAGLPGIPLAIINADKQFILLDSNSKKTRFLIQVVAELSLSNVEVVHSRSERYHPDHCFDAVITRAFSSLKEMLEKTEHLCYSRGRFYAMKGIYPKAELNELPKNIQIETIEKLSIPDLSAERHLIILKRNS